MNHNQSEKLVLIATLPKSGTWYSHAFFWCYDLMLKYQHDYLIGLFKPDLERALKKRKISSITRHKQTLGIDRLNICHSICPGYYELSDINKSRWNELNFPVYGYNWGEKELCTSGDWKKLNPGLNPESRIIYLYRNPLDHFISYYNHAISHVDDNHRHFVETDGTRVPIKNLNDFIFKFSALKGFIKHYHTFKQMHMKYPDNIMMIPYEDLTLTPQDAFHKMLGFMEAAPDSEIKMKLFADALAMSSKDALMNIESKLDDSLAHDQAAGNKHIRDGSIGKWQNYLGQEELEKIEIECQKFGISLRDFKCSTTAFPFSPPSVNR